MFKKFNLLAMFAIFFIFTYSCTNKRSNETITDIDGNVYHTIKIGTQTWMIENLRTTKYNDGTSIPYVNDAMVWFSLTSPGYCYYNNDVANKYTYGALYNWYTINTDKLAPTGWHVPSDADWTTLENYLIANGYNFDGTTNDTKIAKSMASKTGWSISTNAGSIGNNLTNNNSSGFEGLPGGYRIDIGAFHDFGNYGLWWSSTEFSENGAWSCFMSYDNGDIFRENLYLKRYGFSVRCIRDY